MALEDVELKIKVVEELTGKAQEMINSLNALKQGAEKTGDGFKVGAKDAVRFAESLVGIQLSATGAIEIIKGLLKESFGLAKNLEKLSIQTGLTTDELQAYAKVAKDSGTNVESFAGATRMLAEKVLNVKDGVEGASDAFNRWGIDIKGLIDKGATTSDILQEISSKIRDVDDETRKNIMADIFGRIGTEILPVLVQNISAVKKEMQEMGQIMSTSTIDSLRASEEAWDNFMLKITTRIAETGGIIANFFGIYGKTIDATKEKIVRLLAKEGLGSYDVLEAATASAGDYGQALDILIGLEEERHKTQKENTAEWANTEVVINVLTKKLYEFSHGTDEEIKAQEEATKKTKEAAETYKTVTKTKESLSEISKKYKYTLEGEGKAVEELLNKTQKEGDARKIIQERLNEINLDIEHKRKEDEKKALEDKKKLEEKEAEIKENGAEKRNETDKNETEFKKEQDKEKTDFANKQEEKRTEFNDTQSVKRKNNEEKRLKEIEELHKKHYAELNALNDKFNNERETLDKSFEQQQKELAKNFVIDGFKSQKEWDELTAKEKNELLDKLEAGGRLRGKSERDSQIWLAQERQKIQNKLAVEEETLRAKQAQEKTALEFKQLAEADTLAKAQLANLIAENTLIENETKRFNIAQENNQVTHDIAMADEKQLFEDKIAEIREATDKRINESLKTVQTEIDKVSEKLGSLQDKNIKVTIDVVETTTKVGAGSDYYHPTQGW